MKIIQVLDKKNYWKWENNYVHISIKDVSKLDKYYTEDGLPLFICKREPDGKYGYSNSNGNEVNVYWKDEIK